MEIPNRQLRRQLAADNARRQEVLTPVPRDQWPRVEHDEHRLEVWISSYFLVQVFDESHGVRRLSVCRTTMGPDGRWDDGISWDELMDVKRQLGLGDAYGVEVYPRDQDIVDEANMRHLWLLPEPLQIGWSKT